MLGYKVILQSFLSREAFAFLQSANCKNTSGRLNF